MLRDALRRFSAIPSAAVLLLLLAACGPWPSPAMGPDIDRSDESLRVWLSDTPDARPSPFTVFHVNRPAYVAIFDIRPGAGVRAVYPWDASGSGHQVSAGLRSVMPFGFAHGLRSHDAFGFGASFASFGACGTALRSPVVWRLIIASERPLDLERLVGDVAFSFRPAIHSRSFAFGTAFDVMDAIVSRAVPGALSDGELAGGGQWDVYWTSGWSAPACDRARPLPRLVLADPYPDEDPSETADETADDDDAEDGVDDDDAKVVDGFRVPVTTDRPAVAWKGPPQQGSSAGEAEAETPPIPPALLRGPEARTRAATPRLVDWRHQTGPSLDLRDRNRSWDRDRDFRIRSRRWGDAGRGIRFRPPNARPDRAQDRVDPPSPVRRSPTKRPIRPSSSSSDDDRPDKPTDRGGA